MLWPHIPQTVMTEQHNDTVQIMTERHRFPNTRSSVNVWVNLYYWDE